MYRINATNMHTVKDGKTLTEMMAEREVLGKRVQVLREVFDRASANSRSKFCTTPRRMIHMARFTTI